MKNVTFFFCGLDLFMTRVQYKIFGYKIIIVKHLKKTSVSNWNNKFGDFD